MEDREVDNPYMSPQHDESDRRRRTAIEILGAFLAFFGGLLTTAVVTGMVTGLIAFFAGPIGMIFSALLAPGIGILVWNVTRNDYPWFARGALVLGVVWFLLAGGCTLVFINALSHH